MGEDGKDVKVIDGTRALHDHYDQMRQALLAGPEHPRYSYYKKAAMNHRDVIESLIGGDDKALEFAAKQIIKRLPKKPKQLPGIAGFFRRR